MKIPPFLFVENFENDLFCSEWEVGFSKKDQMSRHPDAITSRDAPILTDRHS